MNFFKQIFKGIKAYFIGLVVVATATCAVLGWIAFVNITETKGSLARIGTVHLQKQALKQDMRSAANDAMRLGWAALGTSDDPKSMAGKITAGRAAIVTFNEKSKQASEKFDKAEKEKYVDVIGDWSECERGLNDGFDALEKGDLKAARAAFVNGVAPHAQPINLALEALLKDSHERIEKEVADSTESSSRNLSFFMICAAFGVTVLSVLGIFFVFRITKILSRISENIRKGGSQVLSASEQLSGASQSLSSGSVESASSLQETVSSLEEISSTVKMNADNSREAAGLAEAASKTAKTGENEIQNLISAMADISKGSRKIEEIINVIDDIAFQTNLLALNAAVEAARAGEQGKGFAVVADAVRSLAQRSATSAKDIGHLIRESVEKTQNGSKTADTSGAVLREIVTSVQKVSDLVNEIATASQEQARGISQISKAMNELDHTTQQNAASAEEVASSSEQLSAQATLMQAEVSEMELVLLGQAQTEKGRSNTGHAQMDHATVQKVKSQSKKNGEKAATSQREPAVRLAHSAGSNHSKKAEDIIPFDDLEPLKKVGTTDGF